MGIVGDIIGGVSSSSASKKAAEINAQAQEQNREFAQSMYDQGKALITPEMDSGTAAESNINGLLGIGSASDTAAGTAGLNNYKDTSGYQFLMDQANNGIDANAAAKGSFQSGATAKALSTYDTGLADSTENNYLSQLTDVANRGTSEKNALLGQGTQLVNETTAANNSQAQSSAQNAINQGNIINGTLANINSSFGGGSGGILSTLFGI